MMPSLLNVLLVLSIGCLAVHAICPESEQIHCGTSDRCTRIRYICDGDNDCGDNSDEMSELCALWRNNDCERNYAKCTRQGRSDCVTISRYCEITDPPCEGTVDPRLCQMLKDEKLNPIDTIVVEAGSAIPGVPGGISDMEATSILGQEFLNNVDSTIKHPKCPHMFTRVGVQCISILYYGKMTWGEARAFCQTLGGDLLSFQDIAFYYSFLHHLREHHMTSDFWLGGHLKDESEWVWTDDSHIELGAPYWTIRYDQTCQERHVAFHNTTRPVNDGECYHYHQAPEENGTGGHCTSMNYENFFYISDENCLFKKSPLCVTSTTVD